MCACVSVCVCVTEEHAWDTEPRTYLLLSLLVNLSESLTHLHEVRGMPVDRASDDHHTSGALTLVLHLPGIYWSVATQIREGTRAAVFSILAHHQ